MKFFSADHHFGHSGIVLYCNRPFTTLAEMDAYMIERWNKVVKRGDEVYYLGDFSWYPPDITRAIRFKLNGKIHFIEGNHDKSARASKATFSTYSSYYELNVNHQLIVLSHYPFQEWKNSCHESWHLHGHSHGRLEPKKKHRLDVGVDSFNFTPVSLDEIIEIMGEQNNDQGNRVQQMPQGYREDFSGD
jgi:calcineurin-like phosphoesterase family protein